MDISLVQWRDSLYNVDNIDYNRGEDIMTDKQYDGILQMIGMILDGCKDIDEAKNKIETLRSNNSQEHINKSDK